MSQYPPGDGAMPTDMPQMPEQTGVARPTPAGSQVKLSEAETRRILAKIKADHLAAHEDNQARYRLDIMRYGLWRKKLGMAQSKPGDSNYRVPLVEWLVRTKWAKTLDAFLGDDAEIEAQPTGPTDRAQQHKVSRYMTWLVFNKMNIVKELARFTFQEIVLGRAHAKCVHDVEYLYDASGGKRVWYEGPRFRTVPSYCVIAPPTTGQESDANDFPWFALRYWKTPDELARDEANGYSTGIKDNWEEVIRRAQDRARDTDGNESAQDDLRRIQAEFEGVSSDNPRSEFESIECREHYMRWRMPKRANADVQYDDYKAREMLETELVIRHIPDICGDGLLISCQRLAEMYPLTTRRRPIVTAAIVDDGTYWPAGLPESLAETEVEMSVNYNQMNEAIDYAIMPPVFFVPGMGYPADKGIKLEPGMGYPSTDPKSVNQMQVTANPQLALMRHQMLGGFSEKLSGLPDIALGAQADRPNSPKTFRGQALLQGQSDIRQTLETMFMSEDWAAILDHIKMLVDTYGKPTEEFRVTEEQASGYFETNKGFATITDEERSGRYDFKLKFATSAQSREARKERGLAFGQVAATLPVFLQNANLQRDYLLLMAKNLELDGLMPTLQAIPDQNVPLTPEVENTQMLQGLDPQIHPQDDDAAHLAKHYELAQQQMQMPEAERDTDALHRDIAHMMQHEEQQQRKLAMMAQAQAQANAQAAFGALGIGPQGGQNGNTGAVGQAGGALGGAGAGGGVGQILGAQAGVGQVGPGAGEQLGGFPADTGGGPEFGG